MFSLEALQVEENLADSLASLIEGPAVEEALADSLACIAGLPEPSGGARQWRSRRRKRQQDGSAKSTPRKMEKRQQEGFEARGASGGRQARKPRKPRANQVIERTDRPKQHQRQEAKLVSNGDRDDSPSESELIAIAEVTPATRPRTAKAAMRAAGAVIYGDKAKDKLKDKSKEQAKKKSKGKFCTPVRRQRPTPQETPESPEVEVLEEGPRASSALALVANSPVRSAVTTAAVLPRHYPVINLDGAPTRNALHCRVNKKIKKWRMDSGASPEEAASTARDAWHLVLEFLRTPGS